MPTPPRSNLISFLHDCLAEDRSGQGVSNIFAAKIKRRRVLEGEDRALSQPTGFVELPEKAAQRLVDQVALYRRECELLHGSLIIAGQWQGRRIAAPVLLHRLQGGAIRGVTFFLEGARFRINPSLYDLFDLPDNWEESIAPWLADGLPGMGGMLGLMRGLSEAIPDLNMEGVKDYPRLEKSSRLSESAGLPGLRLHAASALLLSERSRNVRGVLDETRRLAGFSSAGHSAPLRMLFGEASETFKSRKTHPRPAFIPARLSPAQEKLLESTAREPLTFCHGPPGTGKTFTLAACAIDHALRGEPVLIVCRSRQAADVVERAIDRLSGTGELTLRTGNTRARRKLRDRIDLLLSGALTQDAPTRVEEQSGERRLAQTLRNLEKQRKLLEEGLQASFQRGRLFEDPASEEWFRPFRRWWHTREIQRSPLLMDLAQRLHILEDQRVAEARVYLKLRLQSRRAKMVSTFDSKSQLRSYRQALIKRNSGSQQEALAETRMDTVLKIFPIWIVESDEIHRLMPLTKELFSLVVIDEASQCDLASALPVLQRGKRGLISGDPKQLRHVSFLSEARLAALAKAQGLSMNEVEPYHYRRVSLVDAALQRVNNAHFLAEHYRSRPELIRFSSQHFYSNQLRMMREASELAKPVAAFQWVKVEGRRDESGVNHQELQAVVEYLDSWSTQQAETNRRETIGFLSPFRAQADALEAELHRRLSAAQLSRLLGIHQLMASTAHGFQGDERDVMLFSLALSPTCAHGARRFLEREDVFNVSITRARDRMVVFTSISPGQLPADSLLHDWLLSINQTVDLQQHPIKDRFAAELAEALRAEGCHCETGRSVAGVPIDLLATCASRSVAIDLIGHQGMAGEQVPLHQRMLLQRAGLILIPLGLGEWTLQRDLCLAGISDFL